MLVAKDNIKMSFKDVNTMQQMLKNNLTPFEQEVWSFLRRHNQLNGMPSTKGVRNSWDEVHQKVLESVTEASFVVSLTNDHWFSVSFAGDLRSRKIELEKLSKSM